MTKGARLGQHFLTARWAAVSLARAAHIEEKEAVLEVGPGKGALTRELLATQGTVYAIEKDEALVEKLHVTFASEIQTQRLHVITADIRGFDPATIGLEDKKYVVAANIPYYITGEIIRHFLTAAVQPRAMAILIQKEVAQRITSSKGSILSISVKAYGTPRIVEKVSRKCFSPAPSVDSAILTIENISRDFFSEMSEEHFFDVVRAGFASKRKFLVNNLGVRFGKEEALQALLACGMNEKIRAEEVDLGKWKSLALRLHI